MKIDVLQLVMDLSDGLADPATSEEFYQDVVIALGPTELLSQLSLLEHGTEAGVFSAPISTLQILGVFYNDTWLSRATQSGIEALSVMYRDRLGQPVAWSTDMEGDRRFRIFPIPDQGSGPFNFPRGAPMGIDYPEQAIGVIYTEARQDVPVWLELPVALLVLGREFQRESDHRDVDFGQLCATLGTALVDQLR